LDANNEEKEDELRKGVSALGLEDTKNGHGRTVLEQVMASDKLRNEVTRDIRSMLSHSAMEKKVGVEG
jgi:hypothetical protein